MCGGGPPPGTSCDSTALTTPPVSRPWMRMTIGMPSTFIFLPPSDGIWIGFITNGGDVLPCCAGWQNNPRLMIRRARLDTPAVGTRDLHHGQYPADIALTAERRARCSVVIA